MAGWLLDDPHDELALGMRRFSKRRQLRCAQRLDDDVEGGPALIHSRGARQAAGHVNQLSFRDL